MRPGPSSFLLFRRAHPRRPQSRPSSTYHPNPDGLSLWARLRPAVPTVFAWTVITTLAVRLLDIKKQLANVQAQSEAQVKVLERLMARVRDGEELSDMDIRRELEMAGLRERVLTREAEGRVVELELEEARRVSWREALFGRKKRKQTAAEQEQELGQLMAKAGASTNENPAATSRPLDPSPSTRTLM